LGEQVVLGALPWTDIYAYVHFGLKCLLYGAAVLLFLSSIDDVLFDLCHHAHALYRRLVVRPRHPRLTAAELARGVERRTAILLPAWREEAVIVAMLRDLTASLDFANYTVFVGTYSNDPATRHAVEGVARNNSRIRLVDTGHPGPTSKGDCLNAILRAVHAHEAATGVPYEVFVLHDAEDVVHPLELRLFSWLIPRKAMVQLPVVPLEVSPLSLTGAHYMDEFAEHHSKDLIFRERLTGGVPSAGVGCAFSRRAIKTLETVNGGMAFDVFSLTEDYTAAMTLQKHGLPLVFVRFWVDRVQRVATPFGGHRWRVVPELVGTREYFPSSVRAAVRQKARWLTGIAFQGWRTFGWQGPLAQRYALFRDRKAVTTAQVTMLANVLAVAVLALFLGKAAGFVPKGYPPLVPRDSPLFLLLVANAIFLLHRIVHRAWYVYCLYGAIHAITSPLRLLWSNYINFLACSLALWQVSRDMALGRRPGWAKTAHLFPAAPVLGQYRKRMGDIILERGLATQAQIAHALAEQERKAEPLGQILVRLGALSEHDMLTVVARQHDIPYARLPDLTPPIIKLPVAVSLELQTVAMRNDKGDLVLASVRLLTGQDRERLAAILQRPVQQILVSSPWLQLHLDESAKGAE
jgi:adsorption protein B